MISKFLLLAAIFLFASCVAIERNNPDDPGSAYFGKDKPPVGVCGNFEEGEEREHYGKSKAQFCDVRDGKKYVYVEIGSQVWMAENLNYATSGSCYNNQESNCDIYGRLYNWATAKTVCPSGWHLPNNEDWVALIKSINPGCYSITVFCDRVGVNLKTANGWDNDGNGIDDYGFAALPSGYVGLGTFYDLGKSGVWWSESSYDASDAYALPMYDNTDAVKGLNLDKSGFGSIRCLKDN